MIPFQDKVKKKQAVIDRLEWKVKRYEIGILTNGSLKQDLENEDFRLEFRLKELVDAMTFTAMDLKIKSIKQKLTHIKHAHIQPDPVVAQPAAQSAEADAGGAQEPLAGDAGAAV